MIPRKIQLKNFLSYGPQLQIIDFSHYDLICFSGKNGHGKSALLDAMTWAVWGQARKVFGMAKPDAGLLRLGQTQMLVIFDFEFNGKNYRIRREYMETYGKPLSVLEFGLINPETEEFIALTDKTIRTTQEKIENTLRLDFDSFSNSAFLRQGNSNEFSKKAPKDRKQILAAILGLDQYEVIRKRALEKIKEATAKKTVLAMLQEKRLQELSHQDLLTTELTTLNEQMLSLTHEEQAWQNTQSALKEERSLLEQSQAEHALITFHLKQLTEQQQQHLLRMQEIRTQWRTINKKKHSLYTLDQLEHDKKKIMSAITEQQNLFQQTLEKKELLLNLTQQLTLSEQKHKDDLAHKNQVFLLEIERLQSDIKSKNNIAIMLEDELKKNTTEHALIASQITNLNKQLTVLKPLNSMDIVAEEKKFEKRKASYQHFISLGNWINAELQSLSQKKKLVHEDDPSCPLCEQNLSASRRRFLKANFDKTESFLTHRLRRLKRIIPELKEILVNQHAALIANKETVHNAQSIQRKITELVQQGEKIAITNTEITEKHLALHQDKEKHINEIAIQKNRMEQQTLQDILNNDPAYQTIASQKTVLEAQLAAHTYNPDHYTQQQAKLAAIEQSIVEYESLKKEVVQQDNRKKEILTLCNILKTIKKEVCALQHKRADLGDLTAKTAEIQTKEAQQKKSFEDINNKKNILLQTQGSIENQQKQLKKIKLDHEQEIKNIATLDSVIDDYQTISTATGKDGIQALLIEEAIPEIEQEANQLLSQLTNNQAQIFIESLRDLKKGGTKETLDIKISDQNGIRPYEMFSGGEAFRIDFALRIAISKLLARRAGTALQTLIIDEGFGSQDEEGLNYIMDALHAIQDNFSKIIVVSHLPAMKDQFPVQFVISKGVQGSTVTVIEQG